MNGSDNQRLADRKVIYVSFSTEMIPKLTQRSDVLGSTERMVQGQEDLNFTFLAIATYSAEGK
jgi:hypothetical protein